MTRIGRGNVRSRRRGLWLPGLLLGCACAAHGATMQSPRSIEAAARDFLTAQAAAQFPRYQVTVGRLDPRLQLPACGGKLEGFAPPGADPWGNTTVGVRCTGERRWSVFLSAEVQGLRPVVVLKRPVVRGARISADDLALEEHQVTDRPGAYLFEQDHCLGMIAKRNLAAGTALSVSMLEAPLLVRRGQRITIIAQAAGLEVRMAGIALGDGAEGQLVRARNNGSKRVVEGLVVRPGIIRVTM